ncbi:serine hydrolase [Acinetobacter puyangensis]|nr:serine hydrolase [Acinetobacter puyangensis]
MIENFAFINEQLNQKLKGKNIIIKIFDDNPITIFRKNIEHKVVPASTIKIFLLDVILKQNVDLQYYIEIMEDDIVKGSGNNLVVGDSYKIEDLIKNLMISSSNTSAKVLSRYLSENHDILYLNVINEINKKKGMLNTNLVNEHGLANRNQYTTIYDLSLFMDEKINDHYLLEFMNINEYEFYSKNDREVKIKNTFLNMENNIILGRKTGTLVPNVYNIILFFEINYFKGYIIDFYNESAYDRKKDVELVVNLLKSIGA